MPASSEKLPPSNSLPFLIQLYNDTFTTLVEAPKKYPFMLMTGIPGKRFYVINHPDLIQHVLFKKHGNFAYAKPLELMTILTGNALTNIDNSGWHKHRLLMQPAYHMESLKKISTNITSSTNEMILGWKAKGNATINLTHELEVVVIEAVVKSLFSEDVIPGHVELIHNHVNFLGGLGDGKLRNLFSIPWAVPTPKHQTMRKYITELDTLILDIVNKRKKEGLLRDDLLQMLMDSRYAESGEPLTNKQIRDEVMVFFLAGYETTLNAISFTWYLLKKHRDAEPRLKAEALKFAGNRDPVFEDVPQMIFGKQVINESMRMFPPAAGMSRVVIADDEIGGYYVPAGAKVGINIAGLHYHPDFWKDPYKFNPDRFENFEAKGENRFVFLPFGGGPRICIGKNFAMMEMQLINAMLLARVDMELVSEDIKPEALFTVNPGKGVIMRLKKVTVNA